jgi:ABC-type molybdate transport system substrate-binding protein
MRSTLIAWLLVAGLVVGGGTAAAAQDSETVLAFGAASLTNVLDDLSQAFTAKTKVPVKTSYAASSVRRFLLR